MQHKICTLLSKKLNIVNHFHVISVGRNYDTHTPCVIHASKLISQGNVNSCVVPSLRVALLAKKCAKNFDFRSNSGEMLPKTNFPKVSIAPIVAY